MNTEIETLRRQNRNLRRLVIVLTKFVSKFRLGTWTRKSTFILMVRLREWVPDIGITTTALVPGREKPDIKSSAIGETKPF